MSITEEQKTDALNWLDDQVNRVLKDLKTDDIDKALRILSSKK